MDSGVLITLIVFGTPGLIIVMAIWAGVVKARYRAEQSNISQSEREQLENICRVAETMSERIDALEAILDSEMPDWREDHDKR